MQIELPPIKVTAFAVPPYLTTYLSLRGKEKQSLMFMQCIVEGNAVARSEFVQRESNYCISQDTVGNCNVPAVFWYQLA